MKKHRLLLKLGFAETLCVWLRNLLFAERAKITQVLTILRALRPSSRFS